MSSNASPPTYTSQQATADATTQAGLNQKAAQTQQQGNMVNQVTPFGALNYNQTGTWDDGTPRYTATQSLSPENQKMFDQYTQLSGKFGDTGNKLMDSVSDTFSKPFEFDPAVTAKVRGFQNEFLNPQWDRDQSSLENKLANQGITRGSEAWNTETQKFNDSKSRAYDQAYLDTYKTGADLASRERNQPLTELNAFRTGTQPMGQQFAQTPQESVAAPDYMGAQQTAAKSAMDAWTQQQKSSNAMMGGLFGLGAAPLSSSGFWSTMGPSMLAMSDRRLKTDISYIGGDPRGFGVYAFRYLWDDPKIERRTGFMADEVESVRPDVIHDIGGFKAIDYGALQAG